MKSSAIVWSRAETWSGDDLAYSEGMTDEELWSGLLQERMIGRCCHCGAEVVELMPIIGEWVLHSELKQRPGVHDGLPIFGPTNRMRRGKSWSRTRAKRPVEWIGPTPREAGTHDIWLYCLCGKGQLLDVQAARENLATALDNAVE